MWFMPPQPERHVTFGFGELKPRFRWYHYASAIPMLAMFVALVVAQVYYVPWMKYSVASGFFAIAEQFDLSTWVTVLLFIAIVMWITRKSGGGVSISRHTYGFFNKAAVYEEQMFREGAEGWTLRQRITSCLVFGVIHLSNLIYPLATILPLAIGGGIFMAVYLHTYRKTRFRRTAVLAASVWHRVYNRIALIYLGLWLIYFVGEIAIGIVAGAVLIRALTWRFPSLILRSPAVAKAE